MTWPELVRTDPEPPSRSDGAERPGPAATPASRPARYPSPGHTRHTRNSSPPGAQHGRRVWKIAAHLTTPKRHRSRPPGRRLATIRTLRPPATRPPPPPSPDIAPARSPPPSSAQPLPSAAAHPSDTIAPGRHTAANGPGSFRDAPPRASVPQNRPGSAFGQTAGGSVLGPPDRVTHASLYGPPDPLTRASLYGPPDPATNTGSDIWLSRPTW